MAPLANHLVPWSRRIVTIGTVMVAICVPLIIWYIPRSLEYDFSKLRVKIKGQQVSEEAALNERVKKIFGGTLSPVVLVVDRIDQVGPLCDEISRKNQLDPAGAPGGRILQIDLLLPSGHARGAGPKAGQAAGDPEAIGRSVADFLNEDQKKKMDEFKTQFTGGRSPWKTCRKV
jgi:hypothetical protein